MVGLHVIEYLYYGFRGYGESHGFLWVWDGYGDWNAIPAAALWDVRSGRGMSVSRGSKLIAYQLSITTKLLKLP